MARRIVPLTLDRVAELPPAVAECLFWELSPVARGRVPEGEEAATKREWVADVSAEWGTCGQVLRDDGQVRGVVMYAPAGFAAGAGALPNPPTPGGTIVMTSTYVDPAWRRTGVGRALVRAMAADVVRRGDVRTVEAYGAQALRRDAEAVCVCVLPAAFLGAVGFRTDRAHPFLVRMRMDLASTRTWRDEVSAAWAAVAGAIRRPTPPIEATEVDANRVGESRVGTRRVGADSV